jgi:hypothetical protein
MRTTHATRSRALGLLPALALPALAAGCGWFSGAGPTTLTTSVNGRDLVALIDVPATVTASGGGTVIEFSGRKVVVEKDRLLIDGAEKAAIPPRARKIEVTSTRGDITVRADRKQVYPPSP